MIQYDALVPLVAPNVPGCPDPVIKLALQQAGQDFFCRTELWRVECDAVDTINSSVVSLDLPQNVSVVAVYQVFADGVQLTPSHPETVAKSYGDWMTRVSQKTERYWATDENSIRIWPINSVSQSIAAYVSISPTMASEQIPDIATQYLQALSYGALWKLHSMSGVAWAAPDEAKEEGAEFGAAVIRAKTSSLRHGAGPMSVFLRRFA